MKHIMPEIYLLEQLLKEQQNTNKLLQIIIKKINESENKK